MTELKIIKQQEVLGKVFTVYGTIEEPLMLAKDVAEWIDYNKNLVGQMLKTVDEDEKMTSPLHYNGQVRNMWFLTEDGLYEVLMQSRKPIAKDFKKQVKVILKEIRKTGQYQAKALSPMEMVIESAKAIIELENRQRALEQAQQEQQKINDNVQQEVAKVAGVQEVVVQGYGDNWRYVTNGLLRSIAIQRFGGDFQSVYYELYNNLLVYSGIDIYTREKNSAKRGENRSKLDIIGDDKKLKDAYLNAVTKMAVKYNVPLPQGVTNNN